MPMTGKHGAIVVDGEALPHVRHWTLTRTSDNQAYASSSTQGHTRRVAGRRDWSVSFDLYTDTGVLPFAEGDRVTLRLWLHQPTGRYFQGDALIDAIRPVVDVEGAKIVSFTITASADGPLTESA